MTQFIIENSIQIALGLVVTFTGFLYRSFTKSLREREQKQEALEQGIIALLKERLLDIYSQYMEKGYYSIHARNRTDILFKAYEQLGGNGTVKSLIDALKKLPTERESR